MTGVSDTTVATTAASVAAHHDLSSLSVSRSAISAVAPTERQARQVAAAFGRTPRDEDGQGVTVWWPDGNGTEISGRVGAGLR